MVGGVEELEIEEALDGLHYTAIATARRFEFDSQECGYAASTCLRNLQLTATVNSIWIKTYISLAVAPTERCFGIPACPLTITVMSWSSTTSSTAWSPEKLWGIQPSRGRSDDFPLVQADCRYRLVDVYQA
jgi:hypothetical protein